jgi:RimJ/RimL family protein N-acetyltransferase
MKPVVRIRPIEDRDSEMVVRWRNSDFVRRNFIYQDDFTLEGQLHWMEHQVRGGQVAQFIIEEGADRCPVGSVFIRDIDRRHRKGEFGIFIGEQAVTGRGVGAAATALVLDHAFDVLGLHRVFLRVLADNASAIRSYERSGFRHEGVLREDVLLSGEFRDVVLMGVLEEERR